MPDDLLRFVIGPDPLSSGWLWLASALAVALICFYAAVFVLTPGSGDAETPSVVARAGAALARRRFARDAHRVGERLRSGDIGRTEAAAELSRILREFLHRTTGVRAQYMQVTDVASGQLAPAAPLLLRLNDVQFNGRSTEDAGALSGATEELILSWS